MTSLAIDVALARRLVAGQYPAWSALPVVPVPSGGHDNRTFRLGDDLLLRLPSAAAYAAQVAIEQAWLPRLAPQLPLAIPRPVAAGRPMPDYPFPWSVYAWLPGDTAAVALAGVDPARRTDLARALGDFLAVLRRIDATGAPAAGPRSFHRGADLGVYDDEARRAIARLGDALPRADLLAAWEAAVATSWSGPPVWLHGDVAPGNLLVRDGRLAAVIDFGQLAAGDPACDAAIAWTFLAGDARRAFRERLGLDAATWRRARGWALWKAAILVAGLARSNAVETEAASRTLRAVLEED